MGFPGSSLVISLVVQGFPCGSAGKESTCNEGDLGSIPGLGRALGGGHDNPLQHSCLENPHGQRSLAGYNPWGHKVRHDWATKHSTYVNPDLPIYPSPRLFPLVMVLLIIKLILLLTPASPAVGVPPSPPTRGKSTLTLWGFGSNSGTSKMLSVWLLVAPAKAKCSVRFQGQGHTCFLLQCS